MIEWLLECNYRILPNTLIAAETRCKVVASHSSDSVVIKDRNKVTSQFLTLINTRKVELPKTELLGLTDLRGSGRGTYRLQPLCKKAALLISDQVSLQAPRGLL